MTDSTHTHEHDCCAPAQTAPRDEAPTERSGAAGVAAGAGSVLAAFLASACCVGPLVFALLGLGGAGALVALEPYRPLFLAVTALLLGAGFWVTYRPRATAGGGASGVACDCPAPRTNRVGRVLLWLAASLVIAMMALPYVLPLLVG